MNPAITETVTLDALKAVNRPIGEASGMPNAAYTEHQFFEFERDQVFGRTWAALAFCDDHCSEATATPVDFMGLPLLIMRSKDGDLNVFHNVCSHRGMRLVTEEKKTNGLLVCPYHSWTYDLKGNLKATPHIGGVGVHKAEGFACENHGLKAVRCHSWMGVLFINLSGDAPDFDEHVAPLAGRYEQYLGAHGADSLMPSKSDSGLSLEIHCNWKLAVENYCEAYHLPWVHPDLNSYSPLAQHYNMIVDDNSAGQVTNTFAPSLDGDSSLPVFPEWPEDKHEIAEYPVFYPNLLLGYQVNHFFAIIIHPLSAGSIREDLRLFYVDDGATDDQYLLGRESNLKTWRRVFLEDISAVEGMQLGRKSPGYRGGAFSPVMDTITHHFHKWIANKYRQAYQATGD